METRKDEMYRKLPDFAKHQLRVTMEQDGLTKHEVSEVYVVDEMKWMLNHYNEDIASSHHDDFDKKSIQINIDALESWLKKYDSKTEGAR